MPKPLLTIPPNHKVELKQGQTARFVCQFETVTTEKFAIFYWRKDDQPINLLSSNKYHLSQSIAPSTELRMWSKLTIVNVSKEDEGRYTCFCEYNGKIVRQIGVTHTIVSDNSTFVLTLTG